MGSAIDFTEESFKWLYVEQGVSLLYVSTAVCVVYDHITTLDEEIDLVWRRPRWTMVQFFFFTNRYVGDISQIYAAVSMAKHIIQRSSDRKVSLGFPHPCIRNQSFDFVLAIILHLLNPILELYACIYSLTPLLISLSLGHVFNIIFGYLVTIVLCSMQGIMIYRVSSMYNHSRKIIALFAVAAFIEATVVISIQSASYQENAPVPDPAPGVFLCTQKTFPYWMYTIWIPILGFESLVLGLSASLGLKYYKTVRTLANIQLDPSLKLDSLAYILLRDSITFPFICVSACILNIVIWIYLPHAYIQLAFGIAAFAPCVLGPRLILNLREAYYEPFNRECTDGDLQPSGPNMPEREPPRRLHRRTATIDTDSAVEDGLVIVTGTSSNSHR